MNPEETTIKRIPVLIADDHALFRYGMRAMLNAAPGYEVVGEASTGEEAVAMTAELKPEIVLMDLQMPHMNGIEATRRIVEGSPNVGVVMITMFQDDYSLLAAMRAGARGYVLKGADAEEVIKVLEAVKNEEVHFGPEIARRLMGFFNSPQTSPATHHQRAFPELTEREEEVLSLIAQGKSNQEIARELFVSLKTVRNHASNIFLKLQVADRAQAVIRAREAGLGYD